jgi:hypothetical protein
MTQIDPENLARAMQRAPMSTSRLAEQAGISLSYMCDILAGRRTLQRNPDLRRRLAIALDVPQHWIERTV